jgi:hypothetical protein
MARPEGFVREAGGGGAPGAPHAPALVDLGQVPRDTAEALLVDDLLSVFMGQVRGGARARATHPGGCLGGCARRHAMALTTHVCARASAPTACA